MTCRPIAAAFACLVMAAPAFAEPISYVFQPKVGTVWTIKESRTRTTTQVGRPPLVQATTSGRLAVIEETVDGYIMEWVIESLTFNGVTLKEDDGLTELFIGLPIRFDADAAGMPTSVHDAETLIGTAMGTLTKTGADTSNAQVMGMVRQMLSAPEMMISTMLPQAALMGNCQGFTLEPGTKEEFDTVSPNVLGGPPIPAVTTVVLEDTGSATTPALIRIVEAYDPEAAAASIMESLKLIAAQRNLPPPGLDEKMPPLNRVADIACHIDASTGEAVKVLMDMKVEAGEMIKKQDVRDIVITRRN